MASVDDIDELIETRKLNGVDDGLYESDQNVATDEIDLTTVYMKGYADAEEKYREKIKEKRDEINKKYEDSKDENGESPYYYPEYTIKVLEKLLEEK